VNNAINDAVTEIPAVQSCRHPLKEGRAQIPRDRFRGLPQFAHLGVGQRDRRRHQPSHGRA
jgi:hypothetical protein